MRRAGLHSEERLEEWVKFHKTIDLYEDLISGGFRKVHHDVPLIKTSPDTIPFLPPTGQSAFITRKEELARLADTIGTCEKCRLCEKRTNAVPGMGVLDPLVMVIGEGPGEDEDRTGLPFVGKAGQYLDKWLEAIGLSRKENAYIANIVKCRPPQNRDPAPDEAAACLPYLERQISLIRPKAILTVGRIATQILTGRTDGIGTMRGTAFTVYGTPLLPTYHPSGVLRNPSLRQAVWDDLKKLKTLLDAFIHESGAADTVSRKSSDGDHD